MKEILKVLKSHPKSFLFYDDNGSWSIYTSRKDFDALQDLEDEEYDTFAKKITLLEGNDYGSDNVGYAPAIVIALAKQIGMEVDSI